MRVWSIFGHKHQSTWTDHKFRSATVHFLTNLRVLSVQGCTPHLKTFRYLKQEYFLHIADSIWRLNVRVNLRGSTTNRNTKNTPIACGNETGLWENKRVSTQFPKNQKITQLIAFTNSEVKRPYMIFVYDDMQTISQQIPYILSIIVWNL